MIDFLKIALGGLLGGIVVFFGGSLGVSFGASYDATNYTNPAVFEDTVSIWGNAALGNASSDAHTLTGDFTINTNDFIVDASSNEVLIGTTTSSGANVAILGDVPAGNGNPASTTIKFGDSSTTTSRAQFEMQQVDGGVSCIFVNAAGSAFVLQDGACTL